MREVRPYAALSAYQLDKECVLTTAVLGREVRGFPKDWVVCKGDQVIDVLTPLMFGRLYEHAGVVEMRISEMDRSTLAHMLGMPAVENSQTLTRAVLKLATLTIGDIKVNFTPLQWEDLTRRAEKRGQKLVDYMNRLVQRLTQDIWTSAD